MGWGRNPPWRRVLAAADRGGTYVFRDPLDFRVYNLRSAITSDYKCEKAEGSTEVHTSPLRLEPSPNIFLTRPRKKGYTILCV